MPEKRPDPDELLVQLRDDAARAARGKLRIYFGSSAGVGKTYAMLAAGRALKAAGLDVLAGVVETHGRIETAAQLQGLDVLPSAQLTSRGRTLPEFDLDGALARKPALILVDELAHSNVAGSRHPKRWQDIEELQGAGIDVYTTLNVQHLESLNDVVGGITGIRVHETLPDTFFDGADEVVLVDTPADELIGRLKAGKVYLPAQAERAARNFFRKGNLMALRELAQQESGGASRQCRHDGRKLARDAIGSVRDRLHLAGTVDMRASIGLVQNDFLAAIVPDDDATDLAVRLWQQDDQVVARRPVRRTQGLGFDRLLGFAPASRARLGCKLRATGHHRRDGGQHEDNTLHQLAVGSSTLTMNSVPRTPMIAAGVLMRMASGDCLTILPETTARVPFFRRVSNSPWWVVVSKTKRSITSSLLGPADNRLLSWKVMPTEPSAPVFTVSSTSMTAPTGAGINLPLRSICTSPLDTLMRPASPANACVHVHAVASKSTPKTRISLWNVDTLVILPSPVLNRRVGKHRRSRIIGARTMHVTILTAGLPFAGSGKCLCKLRKACTA